MSANRSNQRVIRRPPDASGAVDLNECPRFYRRCQCGRCAICGYAKHTAIHGPFFGQAPGSAPYGHTYAEDE